MQYNCFIFAESILNGLQMQGAVSKIAVDKVVMQ